MIRWHLDREAFVRAFLSKPMIDGLLELWKLKMTMGAEGFSVCLRAEMRKKKNMKNCREIKLENMELIYFVIKTF